ncbi:MAG TPA: tyrosine-protein phosphatase [Blastocatellia bacterium]|nr:tyrosine-protein phosphatase [Blastocatellia bacterium]
MHKGFSVARLSASLIVLSFAVAASAQTKQLDEFPQVDIDNFGKVSDRFYRGAQPDEEDYKVLASLGINSIIDLRNDPREYARRAAEAAGLKYFNIPMSDKKRPSDEQIEAFLDLIKDPATGVFYVHCKGGRHRTGVMGAIYRYNFDGWNYDQVYKEMKQYDYYSRWGHGKLKEYVQDYYERMQTKGIAVSNETSTPN